MHNPQSKQVALIATALCLTVGYCLNCITTLGISPAQAAPTKKDFGPYMKLVQNKIKWTPPAKTTVNSVSVTFTVGKTGAISGVKIKEPTGDTAVDQLAIATIQKSAPFPPLPAGETSLEITFTLPCQRGITTDGVDINPYTHEIYKRIRECWWVPKRLLFMQVELSFEVNKDGTLRKVSIEKSSGDKNADRLAMIGIKRASPFKPLPEGLEAPLKLGYNFGFKNDHDKDFAIFNGQRYNTGESYTTAGGSQVGHKDNTTEKDKAFHLRKEEALIKMADIDELIEKERKVNPDSIKLVPLLIQYAGQNRLIEEHADGLSKLKQALAIARKTPQGNEKELSQSLCALGIVEYNLGHVQEAEPLLKEAIDIKESVLKSQDKELKELLETYGRLLYKQGRIKEYDEVSKKAREITTI
ncbi:MAG: TonB family protein [Candidatus Melainabacteria bacterium]|nr:TonB family protein [Candidatus Melainabacteria bacterium]